MFPNSLLFEIVVGFCPTTALTLYLVPIADLLKRMSSLDGGMGQLHQENGEIRSRLHCVERGCIPFTFRECGSISLLASPGAGFFFF